MPDITVFFATNRKPYRTREPIYADRIAFGADHAGFDGRALRFGRATVTVPPRGEGTVKDVHVAKEDTIASSDRRALRAGSREIFEAIAHATARDGHNLLFVLHGYANTFESGLVGAAEMAERLGRTSVFAFCWPSGERALGINYHSARQEAETAGGAIARSFAILLRYLGSLNQADRCNRRIDVVAHSMGAYALRNAVQAMRETLERDRPTGLIDDLVLVAADDDHDTLGDPNGIGPLVPFAASVTVYYSRADVVLQYSDRVKPNPDRLGQYGPSNMSAIPETVVAVDVTRAIGDDADWLLDHWYHRKTPAVIEDIGRVLKFDGPDPIDLPKRHPLSTGPRRYELRP